MHSRSAPRATKEQKERFETIVRIGCVACNQHGLSLYPVEVHHLLDGGARRGHDETVALCAWHHRGVPPLPGMSNKSATEKFGPSLYHDGKAFHEAYGDDDALLLSQADMIEADSEIPF
jgi:hypothetical protein